MTSVTDLEARVDALEARIGAAPVEDVQVSPPEPPHVLYGPGVGEDTAPAKSAASSKA